MRILFVSPYLPYIPDTGGAIRRIGFLQHFLKQSHVTLVGNYHAPSQREYFYLVQQFCSVLYAFPHFQVPHPSFKYYFPKPGPTLVSMCFNPKVSNVLKELLSTQSFDLIHLEHSYFASVLPSSIDMKKIYIDEHNIESEIYQRQLHVENSISESETATLRLEAELAYSYEQTVWKHYPRCITTSTRESCIICARIPEIQTATVPNCVDIDYFYYHHDRVFNERRIAFLGSLSHSPNVEGLVFFCQFALPLIRREIPDAKLMIIGGPVTGHLLGQLKRYPCHDMLEFVGYVKDARPYLESVCVSVVPIRYGSGTRLKILTSLSMGIPVVTTSVGAEGIDLENNYNSLIADSAQEMADAVIRLLLDPVLQSKIRVNGRQLAVDKYSYRIMGIAIDNALNLFFR